MLGVVGQRLGIGDHDVNLIVLAGILQGDALHEGADIMSDVKPSGGTVTGQDDLFHTLVPFNMLF